MSNYYNNLLKVNEENFTPYKKQELNTVEKIGLDKILSDFIKEYELETFGETYGDISDYTRYNKDNVDILDGYTDTYIFDTYAIGCIWMTENGCLLLECVDLEAYNGENTEEFEESELMDRPNKFDLWAEFDTVLFRLN